MNFKLTTNDLIQHQSNCQKLIIGQGRIFTAFDLVKATKEIAEMTARFSRTFGDVK